MDNTAEKKKKESLSPSQAMAKYGGYNTPPDSGKFDGIVQAAG